MLSADVAPAIAPPALSLLTAGWSVLLHAMALAMTTSVASPRANTRM
jgi:hypothetical protein